MCLRGIYELALSLSLIVDSIFSFLPAVVQSVRYSDHYSYLSDLV
jgi:hypothetical protein